MRKEFNAVLAIPEGASCNIRGKRIECNQGEVKLSRKLDIPGTEVAVSDGKIVFSCAKANKKNIAIIKTGVAHVENMLKGLQEPFTYKLEICHVHFPMNVKVEGNNLIISNFLGEKKPRTVSFDDEVSVSVKGSEITVSSPDREKAGQTAANIEKKTRVSRKDRRIFQDGIFITEKPGGKI